ncbi:MAG: MarR family transcriptional regulator [Clostridiales bacterium]|nr:MarR family transcriptional regulator [Clostridiales bacterium]MBS5878120.1 MarR family transcriptional regulator [Clostridiales bacterium]MDU0939413.1 MarR family transcriptional regulator [Clostridiales bacterium]MDU1042397.1 MarR family transcriptional regulator [Clostridiales bacterium]MDU3490928.1 MarR family transcriptional regulator [Clostridiales bacterium]
MLSEVFTEVYEKFKLNLYKNMFVNLQERETTLTATETFTVEVIHALKNPKVSQLAEFLDMSTPNIAYKIASLVKKGYVEKIQSKEDKREFILKATDKFYAYYDEKNEYIETVLDRLADRVGKDDINKLEYILQVMSEELMPEINKYIANNKVD